MAEIAKVIRTGDILTNLIDPVSKKGVSYHKVLLWYDGTPMTDSKLDSHGIYVKKGNEYFLKSLGDYGQVLQKDIMADMRALSSLEILLLKMGYYKHIQLNGYYVKGDTPAPINYYLSDTTELDDGGSVIEVGDVKLEHFFSTDVNSSYFGVKSDGTETSEQFQKVIDYSYNKQIVLPIGVFKFNKSVKLKTGVKILGTGNVGSLSGSAIMPTLDKESDANFSLFTNDNSLEDVTIINVRTIKGGYGYKFDISNFYITKFNWINCVFQEHQTQSVSFNGSGTNGAYVCNWDTCYFKATKGVYCEGAFNINTFNKCGFENSQGTLLNIESPDVVSQNVNFNRCRIEGATSLVDFPMFKTGVRTFGFFVKECYFENVKNLIHEINGTEQVIYENNTHASSDVSNAFVLNLSGGDISLINNNTLIGIVLNISNNGKVPICVGNNNLNYSGHSLDTFGFIENKYPLSPKSVNNSNVFNKGTYYVNNGINHSGDFVFSKDISNNTPINFIEFTGGSDSGLGFVSRSNLSMELLVNVNATNDGGASKQKTFKFLINVSFYAGLNCSIDIENLGLNNELKLSSSDLTTNGGKITAILDAGSSTGNTVIINTKASYISSNQQASEITFEF